MADAFADLLELIVRDYAITDAQKDVDLNASVDEPAAVIAADKQQIVTETAERRAGSTPQRLPWAAPGAPYLLSFDTTWTNPTDSERNIAWTRAAWAEMCHFAPGGLYLDFAGFREEKEAIVSPWFQNGGKTDENRLDRARTAGSRKKETRVNTRASRLLRTVWTSSAGRGIRRDP